VLNRDYLRAVVLPAVIEATKAAEPRPSESLAADAPAISRMAFTTPSWPLTGAIDALPEGDLGKMNLSLAAVRSSRPYTIALIELPAARTFWRRLVAFSKSGGWRWPELRTVTARFIRMLKASARIGRHYAAHRQKHNARHMINVKVETCRPQSLGSWHR